MTQERKLLTYADVVARYPIKISTLYALVSQERIPHVRLGPRFVLFDAEKLEEWFAEKAVAPRGPKKASGGR